MVIWYLLFSLALCFVLGWPTLEAEQIAARSNTAPTRQAKQVAISEEQAKEIAKHVAATHFAGRGVARTELRYDRMTARFEPGQPGTDNLRDTWYVVIPETRTNVEPSGFHIIIDVETGEWRRPVLE